MTWLDRSLVAFVAVLAVLCLWVVLNRVSPPPALPPVTTAPAEPGSADPGTCPPGSTYVDDLGECLPDLPEPSTPFLST